MEFEVMDDVAEYSASAEAGARAVWKAALLRQSADDIVRGTTAASDEGVARRLVDAKQGSGTLRIDPAVFALSVHP